MTKKPDSTEYPTNRLLARGTPARERWRIIRLLLRAEVIAQLSTAILVGILVLIFGRSNLTLGLLTVVAIAVAVGGIWFVRR